MNKLVILFFCSLILLAGCNKNNTPKPDESGLFVKFFGRAFDDNGFSVVASPEGGFYVAGSVYSATNLDSNIMVVKVDKNGNRVWEKVYDIDITSDEVATDMVLDANGDVVLAGYTASRGENMGDFLLMKINKNDPSIIDTSVFGSNDSDERAYKLVQDKDGAFILYGSIIPKSQNNSMPATSDMYLVKADFTSTIWTRKLGAFSLNDQPGSLKVADNGNLLFCGTAFRNDGTNMRLVYADNFGNLLWDYGFREINSLNEYGYDMAFVSDGYVVAGSKRRSNSDPSGTKDIYIVRTDMNGTLSSDHKSEIILSGTGSKEARSIVAISDREFVIAGYTAEVADNTDIYVAKIDENGSVLASNTFGGSGKDMAHKILKTSDGFIVVGTVRAENNNMMAVYKLNGELKLVP